MIDPLPLVGSVTVGYGENTPSPPKGTEPDLKEACRDFISILYAYTFEQMRSSEDEQEEGLFSGEQASMFMGFLDQEIGKSIASQDGGELVEALYKQLTENLDLKQK